MIFEVVNDLAPAIIYDVKTGLSFSIQAIKQLQGFFGPVFPRLVAGFATEFEAKMINDKNPPQIETLEECAKYIISNLEKYPRGMASIAYGQAKAEKVLQGGVGSGSRSVAKEGIKEILEKTGVADDCPKSTNTFLVYSAIIELAKRTRWEAGDSRITGGEDCVEATYRGCIFSDACKLMAQEGIGKVGGGFECSNARASAATLEYATKIPHDFGMLWFDPPNCTFRIFKVHATQLDPVF